MYRPEKKKNESKLTPIENKPAHIPKGKVNMNELRRRRQRLRDLKELKQYIPMGLSNRDQIKQPKVEIYNYNERKKLERENIKKENEKKKIDFFRQLLDYCKNNNKIPTMKIPEPKIDVNEKGEKITVYESIDNIFNRFTEEQLLEIGILLDFGHKAIEGDPKKRFVVTPIDHGLMSQIKGECTKRIPGYNDKLELLKLEQREDDIEKKKRLLRESIERQQREFEEKHIAIKEKIKETKKEILETKDESGYVRCVCGAILKDPTHPSHLASTRHQEWLDSQKMKKEAI